MTKPSDWIPGAYYRYTPTNRHCHEGIILAVQDEGGVYLVDTFWGARGDSALSIVRSDDEGLATTELLFNPADGWELAGLYLAIADFDDDDVRIITSQHGLQKTIWIRTGSGPSNVKRLANARARTLEARERLDSAIFSFERAIIDEQRLADEIRAAATTETDHS